MGRPTTKAELLSAAGDAFAKLWTLVDSLSAEQQAAEFTFPVEGRKEAHWTRDKNLRDVLIHLYEWHRLLIDWTADKSRGGSAPFLPEPYNWKSYGDMNVEFWKKHQMTSLAKAREMLMKSHAETISVIESYSDTELFTKKHFDWTGTSSLGSYCVSATVAHYEWGAKKLKEHAKSFK